ncbi:esterase family protein [Jatrophihabitans telluris]|uniref:Esterase family protein n=1 Tax=Jatrophihabitans telluris TaxID=2038343 RepID=A0ABY4QXK0_9ACTN|nr:alpha/beta hydrolase-fold protein [Jatrophihabitans telluris]UQX88324.1 esterase family protein [Jatrophihabitans telluris]
MGAGPGALRSIVARVAGESSTTRRRIEVFTPDVADPAALPVFYFLHGLPGNANNLCTAASAAELTTEFRHGTAPFILACPDGNPTANGDAEWADSADGRDKLETFVTVTAVRAVEGAHPRSRGMRAIGGFSMGAFAAASIALRHQGLYAQVASLAGYFRLDDPDSVFGTSQADQDAHDPSALVDRAASLRWYLAEAAEDTDPLTARAADQYGVLLAKVGAPYKLVRTPGAHNGQWAIATLSDVATYLGRGWRV